MTKALKVVILAIFVFQAWFSKSYFYTSDFAKQQAFDAVVEHYKIKDDAIHDILMVNLRYDLTNPGPFRLQRIYSPALDTRLVRMWTYSLFEGGGVPPGNALITPSGRILVGETVYTLVPHIASDYASPEIEIEEGE